jgi:hypothetical protein
MVTTAYNKYGYNLVKGGFFDVRYFGRGRALKKLGWPGISGTNESSELFVIALTM